MMLSARSQSQKTKTYDSTDTRNVQNRQIYRKEGWLVVATGWGDDEDKSGVTNMSTGFLLEWWKCSKIDSGDILKPVDLYFKRVNFMECELYLIKATTEIQRTP